MYQANFLILFLSFSLGAFSQNIVAEYDVIKEISVTMPDKSTRELGPLQSSGFFYKKGERYIYFEKPDYLKDYPEGEIFYYQEGRDNWRGGYSLILDTVASIKYVSIDSGIRRHRPMRSGKLFPIDYNYVQQFDIEYFQWKFYPEQKEINGLKCQKATWSLNGGMQYEVWYCADIPAKAGLLGMTNLPGLVVEATCFPLRTTYKLKKYELNTPIDDAVFWPAEFNQPFKSMKDLGTPASNAKDQKRAELMKQ